MLRRHPDRTNHRVDEQRALMLTYTAPPPRPVRPKRTELDPDRIAAAIAGQAEAKALTTAERRCVVRYLAVVEKLSDPEIAERLRWENDNPDAQPGRNVTTFRLRWEIPSGARLARTAPIRIDVVDAAIAGKATVADLRPRELQTVVRHLTRAGMSDARIALWLNWAPNRKLPRRALYVNNFRYRWDIPAADPARQLAAAPQELATAA